MLISWYSVHKWEEKMNLLLFGCQQIPWTSHYKGPETHNTSVFTSQGMNEILWKYFFHHDFDSNDPRMSQICTCHDCRIIIMACAKLWHDMMIICHVRVTHFFSAKFELWQLYPFVPWVPSCLDISKFHISVYGLELIEAWIKHIWLCNKVFCYISSKMFWVH